MESPIACDLTAMDAEQRERHRTLSGQFQASVQEIRELADGYAFRLPADASMVLMAAEFITLDRLCCPFFTFVLEVEPESGPIWLRLTGREGVKGFLQAELGLD